MPVCGSWWGCSSLGAGSPQQVGRCQLVCCGAEGHVGPQQPCLVLVGACTGSRGRVWVLVGCARSQGSLGSQFLRGAFQVGQGSRAACSSAVPVPTLSRPPLSPRILNKFLDSYQEDVLPWHECVEPCVSFLITHSSSWEVRAPWGSWQAGWLCWLCLSWAGQAGPRWWPQPGLVSEALGEVGRGCPGRVRVLVATCPVWLCLARLWWVLLGWDEGNGAAAPAAGGPGSCQQCPVCSGLRLSRCCRRWLASCTAWAVPARTVWW